MKYAVLSLLASLFLLQGCGNLKKRPESSTSRSITVKAGKVKESGPGNIFNSKSRNAKENSKADAIVRTALNFSGVKYKYGGTTRQGMDCSGLLYVSFNAHDFQLPRTSFAMSEEGRKIDVSKVRKGDLLFFRTSRKGKRINHVGLVVDVDGDEIRFVHASTSRGVIVSSLKEGYWNAAFVKATRVF